MHKNKNTNNTTKEECIIKMGMAQSQARFCQERTKTVVNQKRRLTTKKFDLFLIYAAKSLPEVHKAENGFCLFQRKQLQKYE